MVPAIQTLSTTPANRDLKVHDLLLPDMQLPKIPKYCLSAYSYEYLPCNTVRAQESAVKDNPCNTPSWGVPAGVLRVLLRRKYDLAKYQ